MSDRTSNAGTPLPGGAAMRSGAAAVSRRVAAMFSHRGPGFQRLAQSHAGAVAGDTLVAISLAGTLFFSVPSAEARGNVALYLILTIAPFALLGPLLGRLFERFPAAYRSGMTLSSLFRGVIALIMTFGLGEFWLFPLAFGLLVFSRLHGIGRSSVLPAVLTGSVELITANAQLARIGVLASAVVVPIGALTTRFISPVLTLVLAAAAFIYAGVASGRLPMIRSLSDSRQPIKRSRTRLARSVRASMLATAGARFLNGFLLLLVTFAFRDVEAGLLDFSALLGAAGLGFFLASVATPMLERHLAEEPIVVVALAVEAAAAFIAAQVFGLGAAAALACATGFAWGAAKFGLDGLLQATVPPLDRGRVFTVSETLLQVAWVIGAFIPVGVDVPTTLGLVIAGVVALGIQVVFTTVLLIPIAEARRQPEPEEPAVRRDVTDLF